MNTLASDFSVAQGRNWKLFSFGSWRSAFSFFESFAVVSGCRVSICFAGKFIRKRRKRIQCYHVASIFFCGGVVSVSFYTRNSARGLFQTRLSAGIVFFLRFVVRIGIRAVEIATAKNMSAGFDGRKTCEYVSFMQNNFCYNNFMILTSVSFATD